MMPSVVAFDGRYINDRYHGIGRYAFNLLDALTQLDTRRRYLLFFNPAYPNSRFPLERLRERPHIELLPTRLPLYHPGEQLAWPWLLRRHHVKIFHTPYVVIPWLSSVHSLMTIHDLIFERFPEYRPRSLLQRFYEPVTTLSLKRAGMLCTLSRATYHDVLAYYQPKNIPVCVTGSAIDPHFQHVYDQTRLDEVRARYDLPERFILTVGAGRPHKNIITLVKAFQRLEPSHHVSLVIAGEQDQRFPDLVGTQIRQAGIELRVKRPGLIREADLPAIYTLAEIFVFPSLVEGYGLPPLEAMACGIPVIASTTPAVAEVTGDAALTFHPQDVSQLTHHLACLLTDTTLRDSLRQRGYEHIQTFTWEQVARATLRAYAMLEKRRQAPAPHSR